MITLTQQATPYYNIDFSKWIISDFYNVFGIRRKQKQSVTILATTQQP